MADAFRPFITQIVEFFKELAAGGTETQETVGKILAFAMGIEKLGGLLFGAILAIDSFGVSMKGIFDLIAGGAQVMWNGFEILLTGIKGAILIIEGPVRGDARQAHLRDVPRAERTDGGHHEAGRADQSLVCQERRGSGGGPRPSGPGALDLGGTTAATTEKVDAAGRSISELPEHKSVLVTVNGEEVADNVAALTKAIDAMTIKASAPIKVDVPPVLDVVIWPKIDKKEEEAAKKALATLAGDKDVKLTAKLDELKLKEQSDIIQKSIEWKAKVDIAQVEAGAKIIEATFKSVDTVITSTGTTISSLLDALTGGKLDTRVRFKIEDLLKEEAEARKKALETSLKLAEQQIELNKLRLERLQNGESTINVSADGLKPHLEMILWEILEAIQIRASESSSEFLLGFS